MLYFQNAAIAAPNIFGDAAAANERVIHRRCEIDLPRFQINLFKPATRKLDELVASASSVDMPNSFLAAIVFWHVCGIPLSVT